MSDYKQKTELTEFGKRIAEKRKEHGLKQDELAKKLGISRVALTKIEGGTQNMQIEPFARMCRVLNTSADYFLNGSSAESMDVFVETGLKERSLKKLAHTCDANEAFNDGFRGSAVYPPMIDVINELLSGDDFYSWVRDFNRLRYDLGQILSEIAETELRKSAVKQYSDEFHEAREQIRELIERGEFIRWQLSQKMAEFTGRLLAVR
jgi:transcriptional regulator with XRE-family HTH domain